MKIFISENLKHLDVEKLWPVILSKYRASFPNLSHVLVILRTMPVSNAILERCFSTMAVVKLFGGTD